MKGFIEVHDIEWGNKPVLINIPHITDVRDNFVYMDNVLPNDTDYFHVKCAEDYFEIKDKIKDATR